MVGIWHHFGIPGFLSGGKIFVLHVLHLHSWPEFRILHLLIVLNWPKLSKYFIFDFAFMLEIINYLRGLCVIFIVKHLSGQSKH